MRKVYILLILFLITLSNCSDDESLNPPVAEYNFNKGGDYAPVQVNFSNQSTDAEYCIWDFGDGFISTENNPEHIFEKAGTYTVTLTAVNKDGSNQVSEIFTILQPTAYTISNSSEVPIYSVFSFYDNGSSATDVYEHGIINSEEKSTPVLTGNPSICIGFYYGNWYLVANPYAIFSDQINNLPIYNETNVIEIGKSISFPNIDLNQLSSLPTIKIKDLLAQ